MPGDERCEEFSDIIPKIPNLFLCDLLFFLKHSLILPSLKLTAKAPKIGWKMNVGMAYSSGASAVSFRKGIDCFFGHLQLSFHSLVKGTS